MDKKDIRIVFAVPSLASEYLGVGLLAACLKEKGFHNIAVSSYEEKSIQVHIAGSRQAVVAFCTFAPFIDQAQNAAIRIKQRFPHVVVLAGGPHATLAPGLVLENGFDGVCIGDGEEAFPELMERYADAGRIPFNVKNWWVKGQDGRVYRNNLREPVENLDLLPLAQRNLFPKAWFVKKGVRRFIFSRGCPYQCAYCTVAGISNVYGGKGYYRVRSPQSAVAEIKTTLSDCRMVSIVDAIFGIDMAWLEEFTRLYARDIGLPFYCNSEVRFINERYADLLKKAGCRLVLLGLETADDKMRQKVLKKNFSRQEFEQSIQILRRHGIKVGVYSMLGIPGGTLEQDLETLRLNQIVRADFPTARIFSLFPGTSLFQACCADRAGFETKVRTIRNVYWPVMSSPEIRRDLKELLRLHCLFSICVWLRTPVFVIRFLVRLPLWWAYRMLARISFVFQYGFYY